MTQEESRLMLEHRHRMELKDTMEQMAGLWCIFARTFHGSKYADAEHAFGVMVREYHESVDQVQLVRLAIKKFEDECLSTHCYEDAPKILKDLFEFSVSAAEEFAQLAAVAQKALGSGFVEVRK